MSTTVTLIQTTPTSSWLQSRVLQKFIHNKLSMVGMAMLVFLIASCFIGPYLIVYDELHIDLRARFAPPLSGGHIFGTEPLGRDIAARLFHAGQISLTVGFFAMLISTFIGAVIGIIAGYYRGWVNTVLMRFTDAFLSFPSVFLLLALAAFIKPSSIMITLIIAVTSWMELARIVEAEVVTT